VPEAAAGVVGAVQGREGALTPDAAQSFAEEVLTEDRPAFARETFRTFGDDSFFAKAITNVAPSVGRSLATIPAYLGTAAAVGALPVTGGATAPAVAAGIGAAGGIAYRQQAFEDTIAFLEDAEITAGRPLTDEERVAVAQQYKDNITASGLWEAAPEAIASGIEAAIFRGAFRAPGLRNLLGAGAKTLATETATEIPTAIGQSQALEGTPIGAAEGEGLRFTPGGVSEAFTEVIPGIVGTSLVMAGGANVSGAAFNRLADRRDLARFKAQTGLEVTPEISKQAILDARNKAYTILASAEDPSDPRVQEQIARIVEEAQGVRRLADAEAEIAEEQTAVVEEQASPLEAFQQKYDFGVKITENDDGTVTAKVGNTTHTGTIEELEADPLFQQDAATAKEQDPLPTIQQRYEGVEGVVFARGKGKKIIATYNNGRSSTEQDAAYFLPAGEDQQSRFEAEALRQPAPAAQEAAAAAAAPEQLDLGLPEVERTGAPVQLPDTPSPVQAETVEEEAEQLELDFDRENTPIENHTEQFGELAKDKNDVYSPVEGEHKNDVLILEDGTYARKDWNAEGPRKWKVVKDGKVVREGLTKAEANAALVQGDFASTAPASTETEQTPTERDVIPQRVMEEGNYDVGKETYGTLSGAQRKLAKVRAGLTFGEDAQVVAMRDGSYKVATKVGAAQASVAEETTETAEPAEEVAEEAAIPEEVAGEPVASEPLSAFSKLLESLFGVRVIFFKDAGVARGVGINGQRVGDNIYINTESSRPGNIILGHELWHWLRTNTNEDVLGKLEALVNKYATREARGESFDARKARYEEHQGREMTDQEVMEEFIADEFGVAVSDPQFQKELAEVVNSTEPGLLQQLKDFLLKMLDGVLLKGHPLNQYYADAAKFRDDFTAAFDAVREDTDAGGRPTQTPFEESQQHALSEPDEDTLFIERTADREDTAMLMGQGAYERKGLEEKREIYKQRVREQLKDYPEAKVEKAIDNNLSRPTRFTLGDSADVSLVLTPEELEEYKVLRPSIMKDGQQYNGRPGEAHPQLMTRLFGVAYLEGNVEWGFARHDDIFLSRQVSMKYLKDENKPVYDAVQKIYKQNGQTNPILTESLEAYTLAEAMGFPTENMSLAEEQVFDLRPALKYDNRTIVGRVKGDHYAIISALGPMYAPSLNQGYGFLTPENEWLPSEDVGGILKWAKKNEPDLAKWIEKIRRTEGLESRDGAEIITSVDVADYYSDRGYSLAEVYEDGAAQLGKVVDRATKKAHKLMQDTVTALQDKDSTSLEVAGKYTAPKYLSKFLPMQFLVRAFKEKMPLLNDYYNTLREFSNTRVASVNDWVDTIISEVQNKHAKHQDKFNEVTLTNSFLRITPWQSKTEQDWVSKELRSDPNASQQQKLDSARKAWKDAGMDKDTGLSFDDAYKKGSSLYNTLPAEIKDLYKKAVEKMRAMYVAELNAYIKMLQKDANLDDKQLRHISDQIGNTFNFLKGAYWPLGRFGNYTLNIQRVDGDGKAVGKPTFQKFQTKLERDLAQKEAQETYSSQHQIVPGYVDNNGALKQRVPHAFAESVTKNIQDAMKDAGVTEVTSSEVANMIGEMYVMWQPETSALKNNLKRDNIKGYSQDALRSSTDYMVRHSNRLAYLKQGHELDRQIKMMEKDLKDRAKAGEDVDLLNGILIDVNSRLKATREETVNAVGRSLSKLSSIYYMFSPSAYMVQMSQPYAIALPKMAAHYGGMTKALAAISKATKEALFNRDYSINHLSNSQDPDVVQVRDVRDQLRAEVTLADTTRGPYDTREIGNAKLAKAEREKLIATLSPVQRRQLALLQAIDEGIIDISQLNEAIDTMGGQERVGATSLLLLFMKHGEETSRKITMLAAYDLNESKGHEDAYAESWKTALETMYDYRKEAKPAILQKNLPRVIAQFQYYRLATLSRLVLLMKEAIKDANPEVQAMARRELTYITSASLALSGAVGSPVTAGILALLDDEGDDDEVPVDATTQLDIHLRKNYGDTVADVGMYGLPGLLGADISRRIGLTDVFGLGSDDPAWLHGGQYADWQMTRKVLGPSYNMIRGWAEGYDKIVNEGETMEGMIQMTPKGIRDFLKAMQRADEGIKDGTGRVIMKPEDIDATALMLLAVGINPTDMSTPSKRARAEAQMNTVISERRADIINDINKALESGDEGDLKKAYARRTTFNKAMPLFAIGGRDIRAAVRSRIRNERGVRTRRGKRLQQQFGFGLEE
jgi:hypothetical protein